MAAEAPAAGRGGRRRAVILTIVAAGLWAFVSLGISPADVLPSRSEAAALAKFLGHALSPALSYESEFVPASAPPLLVKALDGARRTVVIAAAATSLAVLAGLLLAFFASTAWWADAEDGARRVAGPAVFAATRTLIALMRSVHELLWAVLLLAALGLSDLAAVIAIAIPYAGTLAKVFSEMIDEAPRDAARALEACGASPLQTYSFALVPRALPDMGSYAFYRFECAIRSSAVLGFFGPETLGKFIKQSWNENHYGELWTYLYALFALVALLDWWSGRLRMRFRV